MKALQILLQIAGLVVLVPAVAIATLRIEKSNDDGPSILFAGPLTKPEEVPEGRFDVLILSPRNPRAVAVAAAADAPLIVVDDSFQCASLPGQARMSLEVLHAFQKALLPYQSVLLAPGESWDIQAQK